MGWRGLVGSVLVLVACEGGGDPREIPLGNPSTATIGAAGGSLTSSDGRLTIDIPAGALEADTAIEIQELEWVDGRAWALRPDGLTFGAPVTATITLPESEIGAVTTETFTGEELRLVPTPSFSHISFASESIEDELTVEVAHREADAEIDYVIPLSHFSVISFVSTNAGVSAEATRPTLGIGEVFAAGSFLEGTGEEDQVLLWFRCDGMLSQQPVHAQRVVDSMRVANPDPVRIQALGPAAPYQHAPVGYEGWIQSFECTEAGIDEFEILPTLRWTLLESTGDCTLEEGPDTLVARRSVECTDACPAPDPVDLSVTAEGDPALDLRCGRSGTWGGQSWVRASFEGAWPPGDFFSWFVTVRLRSEAGEIGSYTIQMHNGVMEIIRAGAVGEGSTHAIGGNGVTVTFSLPSGVPETITEYVIESGIQKEEGGVRLTDTIGPVSFDRTEHRS